MENIKTFKRRHTQFEIGSFDKDKEIEFCMSENLGDRDITIYLDYNEVVEVINHLTKCIESIKPELNKS